MLMLVWLLSLTASIVSIRLALLIRTKLAAWTICQSWNWMLAALLSSAVHSVVSLPPLNLSAGVRSAAAYFTATMLLTPLVTTLGARRPGLSPWHWFVVLPMIAVLQWPALSQLTGSHWRTPLELNGPAAMGVIMVLIMSAGTLLGTRAAGFALLYGSGILVFLIPVAGLSISQISLEAGGAILILAALLAARKNLERHEVQLLAAQTMGERMTAVWEYFRSLYGIAWTRRVQERINQFAPAEKWTVELKTHGFLRLDGSLPTDEELRLPMHTFAWVLARFADRTWLHTALNPQNPNDPNDRLH